MKIVIDIAGKNQWYFRIVAENGKTLAHSESYTRKRNALLAANKIAGGTFTIVEAA